LHARQSEQQQVVVKRVGVGAVQAQVRGAAGVEPLSGRAPSGRLVGSGYCIFEIDEDYVGACAPCRLEAFGTVARYKEVRAVRHLT
jgi:hypothetical protein